MKIGQTSFIFFISKFGSSAVAFLATVYLARELGAGILGVYFLTLAVVIWMQLVATMGISKAVVKKVSEGTERQQYIAAGLSLQFIMVIILSLGAYLIRHHLEQYIGASVIYFVIFIFVTNVIFSFLGAILKGLSQVHTFAVTDTVKQVTRAIIQVGIVMIGFGITGLMIGHIMGTLIAIILVMLFYPVNFYLPEKYHFLELVSYAKYAWATDLEIQSFSWIDTIVLGFFVSTTLVGIYEITWNVASFLALFSTAISKTLFPEISKASIENDFEVIKSYLNQSLSYCGLLLIPGFVGSILLGEQILRIYGEEFRRGAHLLMILVAAQLFYAYQSQFVNTLNSINRPDRAFRVNVVFILTNTILNIILVYFYSWTGAAIATMSSAFVGFLVGYLYLSSFVQVDWPLKMMANEWYAAFLMGISVWFLMFIMRSLLNIPLSIPIAIILIGIGGGLYFVILLIISSVFRTTVINNIPDVITNRLVSYNK